MTTPIKQTGTKITDPLGEAQLADLLTGNRDGYGSQDEMKRLARLRTQDADGKVYLMGGPLSHCNGGHKLGAKVYKTREDISRYETASSRGFVGVIEIDLNTRVATNQWFAAEKMPANPSNWKPWTPQVTFPSDPFFAPTMQDLYTLNTTKPVQASSSGPAYVPKCTSCGCSITPATNATNTLFTSLKLAIRMLLRR